tara:strand:+ start:11768 stop:12811 length:1044 start_codon:yes stop_codon:yes gene_type:complete
MLHHTVIVSKRLVPSHSQLTDATEIDHYWSSLMRFWGVHGRRVISSSFFPGCNPCSISKKLAPRLSTQRYTICLKSDGVRYVLFLTKRMGQSDVGVALMIDRSRNMYEVEVAAPEEHFLTGTVLEGELVWKQPDEQTMIYYVFDVIVDRGRKQLTKPFEERLATATALTRFSSELRNESESRILETQSVVLSQFDPQVEMKPKTFVDRIFATRLWNERNESEHRVDGIILQSMDAPYTMGTAEDGSVFKWKEHSTVDLRGIPPNVHAAEAPLPARLCDRDVVFETSRVAATSEHDVIEYHVDVTEGEVRLLPVRTRPDKTSANGLRVITATVDDVIHAITPEELAVV